MVCVYLRIYGRWGNKRKDVFIRVIFGLFIVIIWKRIVVGVGSGFIWVRGLIGRVGGSV